MNLALLFFSRRRWGEHLDDVLLIFATFLAVVVLISG
jgi:hypothetical protein